MRRGAQTDSGEGRIGKGGHTDSYGTGQCSSMPSYAPSSTSCAGSGTKSLSVSLSGRARVQSQSVFVASGTDWSGTLSPVQVSDIECTMFSGAWSLRSRLLYLKNNDTRHKYSSFDIRLNEYLLHKFVKYYSGHKTLGMLIFRTECPFERQWIVGSIDFVSCHACSIVMYSLR